MAGMCWNDSNRERPKYAVLVQNHKSHTDWPGIEGEPQRWKTDDKSPEPWQSSARISAQLNVTEEEVTSDILRTDEHISNTMELSFDNSILF
jgi:hypothetical protein